MQVKILTISKKKEEKKKGYRFRLTYFKREIVVFFKKKMRQKLKRF